ncbi:signaling threshold-regulating transmembrane adapter 1 [Ctenodactylus gundi]
MRSCGWSASDPGRPSEATPNSRESPRTSGRECRVREHVDVPRISLILPPRSDPSPTGSRAAWGGASSVSSDSDAGIFPPMTQAWGLWTLLGALTLLLLILIAVLLFQWTCGWSRSHSGGHGRSGGSVEEVPLYGNLHYLQTGRLTQEPRPDQQDPSPGGPARAAEEVMCYTSLQLPPPQGRIPSPVTPIKYSEVVVDSEVKPQATDTEPELYASVCAQTRRARASFPDQAYANSQPAPS